MTDETSIWPLEDMAGRWHVVDELDDEERLPQHRMDLQIEAAPTLQISILSRVNGTPMLTVADASFDGTTLRFRLPPPQGHPPEEMPFLVMTVSGAKMLGSWQRQGAPFGPPLKLVRGRNE